MKNSLNSLQELSIDAMVEINGGISVKTLIIGNIVTAICPIAGIGFWVGYLVNS